MLHSELQQILHFWFGNLKDASHFPKEKASIWFSKNEDIDCEIKKQFQETIAAADKGRYDAFLSDPKALLALIILYDQFPRNIHRNSPQAFAWDNKALLFSKQGIVENLDQALFPIERIFFYMPLMHSENLKDQDQCIERFQKLVEEHVGILKTTFQKNLEYAHAHRDIIHRFSRFPHRNQVLRRVSSHEEMVFLSGPNSSF